MNKFAEKKHTSQWLWWALAITIAASIWSALQGEKAQDFDSTELVAPRKSIPTITSTSRKDNDLDADTHKPTTIAWDKLNRSSSVKMAVNLFRPHSWAPPPAKVKPVAGPPPVAPPAPFQYVGKLENTPHGMLVFLVRLNKVYSVAVGQKLDAQWRLDGEDAQFLKLTYLPLNLPQTLSKGANQATMPVSALPAIQESM